MRFDATVTFVNGGDLSARGFVLDIPDDDITDADLGELFVRHLGLLMVGEVRISGKALLREPHKGSRGVATGQRQRTLVDLTHPVEEGMITYPGLPSPVLGAHLTREASRDHYAAGTEFLIGTISMAGNTGTYLDSPFHRFDGGTDLAGLEIATFADLDGVVVRVADSADRGVDRAVLLPLDVTGRAVLIHTGWDRHWRTDDYGKPNPFLTADGARWLAEQGAALVGIDSINIDDITAADRPAHSTLLEAGIPVVEHLRGLEQLPPQGFRFHAAPVPVKDFGTFPVRAYAVLG